MPCSTENSLFTLHWTGSWDGTGNGTRTIRNNRSWSLSSLFWNNVNISASYIRTHWSYNLNLLSHSLFSLPYPNTPGSLSFYIIFIDMLFPVSRTKVFFVPLPSTLERLFIVCVMYIFLLPGVYLSPKYTYMYVYLAGARWLLVEAHNVSTWEPAVDTTDPSTSAWKQAGAASQGRVSVCGD